MSTSPTIARAEAHVIRRVPFRERKPGKIIREDSVIVRVFPVRALGRKVRHEARWKFAGRLHRKTFSDQPNGKSSRTLAEEFARAEAEKIANGKTVGAGFSQADEACHVRITVRAALNDQRTGREEYLEVKLDRLCAAEEKLHIAGMTLDEAVQLALHHNPRAHFSKNVAEVVAELLDDVKSRSVRQGGSLCHYRNLKARLNAFAQEFTGPINSLSRPPIQTWLKRLPYEAKTVNHYRAAAVSLFRHARAQNYCARDLADSIASIATFDIKPRVPEPYKPRELRALLDYVHEKHPKHLAPIVLVAFCGLRTCEAGDEKGKMDWSDIDFERRQIKVRADKSKVGKNRWAYFPENAFAWLKLVAKSSGPISSVDRIPEAITRLCKNAGVPRRKNGLRSGFISHRVGLTGDMKQTAAEAGTSVAKIESNYLDWPTKNDAKSWFGIFPDDRQLRLDW